MLSEENGDKAAAHHNVFMVHEHVGKTRSWLQ